MITLILLGLMFFSHILFFLNQLKRDVHHMQLHSYRNLRYMRWILSHKRLAFDFKSLPLLLLVIPAWIGFASMTLFTLSFGWLGLLWINRKPIASKKPLVWTSRVKRLYTANAVLLLLFDGTMLAILYHGHDASCVIGVSIGLIAWHLLSFIPMMASNLLMMPFESLINFSYVYRAKRYLSRFQDLQKIGITGSFGKTSTKHFLTELLNSRFNTLMTPGSFNTLMGVTRTIRESLKPIHEAFVAEMGAKAPGDIQELCELVSPKIGMLTAVGEQHLETFKTLERIIQTKYELIESLPIEDGLAVFNADDPICCQLAEKTRVRTVTYAVDNQSADYYVNDFQMTSTGSRFTVCHGSAECVSFQTKLLGRHNVLNIVGAIAVACELGMPMSELPPLVKGLKPVPHRLELKPSSEGTTVIDDAFNSNPLGAEMALEVLQTLPGNRKIIITPGMVELGSSEYVLNKTFGEQMARVCDIVILVGKKQTLPIQEGLKDQHFPLENCFVARNLLEARQYLDKIISRGDVILFENDLPDIYEM